MTVKLPSGEGVSYVYDGQNRLVGKEVSGTLTEGFLYDGQLAPVTMLDGSGNIVEQFVYGTRPNVPDYIIKGGVEYRVLSDQVGSPVLIVNTATGAIVEQINYDAWGNITSDSNPGFQPLGFAGGLYDRDTGLVHFGARDYDPETGRWITKDPAGFAGGDTNLYGYVVNDPVNAFDPLGLWEFGDPLPQGLVNAAAGFGDALSFGLTDLARNALGTNDVVNHCSGAYGIAHDVGTAYALAMGIGRLAYAGAAKALPLMIRSAGSEEERALAISAGRNTLKHVFRVDITRSSTYKIYNPTDLLAQKGPAGLIESATRTNGNLNALAATALVIISNESSSCGCDR